MEEFKRQLSEIYNNCYEEFYQLFMYEMIYQKTRSQLRYQLEPMFDGTGIKVKCDEENNPPDIVDKGIIMLRFSKKVVNETHIIDIPFGAKL